MVVPTPDEEDATSEEEDEDEDEDATVEDEDEDEEPPPPPIESDGDEDASLSSNWLPVLSSGNARFFIVRSCPGRARLFDERGAVVSQQLPERKVRVGGLLVPPH